MEAENLLQFINEERLPFAILAIIAGLLAVRFITKFLDDLGERFTDRRLLFKRLSALSRFLIYLGVTVVVVVSVVKFERGAVVALTGIGVTLGIALRDILSSVMGGVMLLLDAPFQVGDRVSISGHYGEVTRIGLRSVQLRTLNDNLVSVPNNRFLTESVASASGGELHCMVVIPFYIGAAEDFDRARRIIAEATATSRYVYFERPVVTLVSDEFLGERFVTVITVKAYVFDSRYEKAFGSDVTQRVKRAFKKAGIRTPDQQYRDVDLDLLGDPA